MQLWHYCLLVTAGLLYMFRTLSASIIRSTKNCSSSPRIHVMGRDDVYPARTSKVGSLLHYVIAYLGLKHKIKYISIQNVSFCGFELCILKIWTSDAITA